MTPCQVISDTSKAPHSLRSGTTQPITVSHHRRHESSNIYKLRNAFCCYGIILTPKHSLFKHKQELCHHVYNEPEQLKKKALRVTLNKITVAKILLNIRVHPRRGHEGPEGEWRYNPTLSSTSALDEGGPSTPCPSTALPPGMT